MQTLLSMKFLDMSIKVHRARRPQCMTGARRTLHIDFSGKGIVRLEVGSQHFSGLRICRTPMTPGINHIPITILSNCMLQGGWVTHRVAHKCSDWGRKVPIIASIVERLGCEIHPDAWKGAPWRCLKTSATYSFQLTSCCALQYY